MTASGDIILLSPPRLDSIVMYNVYFETCLDYSVLNPDSIYHMLTISLLWNRHLLYCFSPELSKSVWLAPQMSLLGIMFIILLLYYSEHDKGRI